jgi:hypothetical protein
MWYRRRSFVAAVVAGLTLGLLVQAAGQSGQTELRVDFEDATTGKLPPSFTAGLTGNGGPVRWAVLDDPSAPAGPKVLAETSQDTTDYRFPLAILDGFAAQDVKVRVRFRPVSGTVDRAQPA